MILKISLAAVTLSAALISQVATAQISETGWELTPQFGTEQSWPTTGTVYGLGQEFELRPLVPYPGQADFPTFNSIPMQSFGHQQPFETFGQPIGGYSPPLVESPQSFDQLNPPTVIIGSNQEIIISAEPVDGQIIGIVKSDGTIVPLGQSSGMASLTLPNSDTLLGAPVASVETPAKEVKESVVGDNFGEPIVEPSGGGTVQEVTDESAELPGALVIPSTEIAPTESPQDVVDAQLEKQKERSSRLREAGIRLQEMDAVIEGLKAENSKLDKKIAAQYLSIEKAKAADKNSKANMEKRKANVVEQSAELKKAAAQLAQLKRENAQLQQKLEASTKQSDQSVEGTKELSTLRKELVVANRELVTLRRTASDSAANAERLKQRVTRFSDSATSLAEELKAKKKEKAALATQGEALTLQLANLRKASGGTAKLKQELETAKLAQQDLKTKLEEASKAKSKASDAKEDYDKLKKSHAKTLQEHKASQESLKKLQSKLKGIEKKHAAALETATTELAKQKKKNATMKAEFIEAFEADKKMKAKKGSDKPMTEAEVREAWNKKRLEEDKAKKSDESLQAEKADNTERSEKAAKKKKSKTKKKSSTKEAKLLEREKQLREEMKKKMAEAESRIRTVGKKKVDALIKKGKKDDSDEVKESKKQTEESIKISNRKIRARYERKIKRLR